MQTANSIDPQLSDILACPRDHGALELNDGHLCCAHGHRYPIVDGIPVLLLAEKEPTLAITTASLRAAETGNGGPLYLDTISLTDAQKRGIERDWRAGPKIDPAISYLIAATSGLGYVKLIGRLDRYPIPNIPIAAGSGELLLDIGCNWGRWSVSAARKGWKVIGVDPSLGALMAAQRAFAPLGLDIHWVCGDARYLPFSSRMFAGVFSYGVLQHFSEDDARLAIAEVARSLRADGFTKIQMAHAGGLRARYVRSRPHYGKTGTFYVRYWPLAALRDAFAKLVGATQLSAEGFGGLGLLAEDWPMVSVRAKLLIAVSLAMKALARLFPPLIRLADSIYVTAIKR